MFTSPPCWVISTSSSVNRPSIEQLVFSAEYSILDSCFGESWAKKEGGKKTSLFSHVPSLSLLCILFRGNWSLLRRARLLVLKALVYFHFLKEEKTVWKELNSYKLTNL